MSVLWAPKGGAALEVCFTSDDERLNPCTAAAGSPIPGHRGTVLCAAWSPACGKLFVSAGSDGIVIVWDASSGKAIRTLDGHLGRPVLAACFSPTGQLICSCDDGSAAEEPARLHHSQAHHASSSVNLTSANTGSLLQRLELPPSAQSGARGGFACAFSPAAGASCDAGGEQGVVLAVGCSEDQVVIFGQDPSSALVGGGLWRATSSLSGVHSGAVLSLAFSPSGRFLCSGGWDGVLGVWSVNTAARCIATVRAHSARVRCVAWSGDWIASASDDATVRVWGIPVAAAAAAASCDGGGGGVAAVTVLTSAAVLRGHFDWVRPIGSIAHFHTASPPATIYSPHCAATPPRPFGGGMDALSRSPALPTSLTGPSARSDSSHLPRTERGSSLPQTTPRRAPPPAPLLHALFNLQALAAAGKAPLSVRTPLCALFRVAARR